MEKVRRVRQLIRELNEAPQHTDSKPLHEVLAENRLKQDEEFQLRYQQRNAFNALSPTDSQWLKKVKEKANSKEAELERQIAQGLKSKPKNTKESTPITLPTGRVKKKKSSLIK